MKENVTERWNQKPEKEINKKNDIIQETKGTSER